MLTRDALQDIAEGRRALNRDERDWCIGEAMVLSGFQNNPRATARRRRSRAGPADPRHACVGLTGRASPRILHRA